MSFQKIKTFLIGEGYEVGEVVYLEQQEKIDTSDKWIVISKRNWRGLVKIQNAENRVKTVPWYMLEPIEEDSENKNVTNSF